MIPSIAFGEIIFMSSDPKRLFPSNMSNSLLTPLNIFSEWYDEADRAQKIGKIKDKSSFCLASATTDGKPSARILLLKNYNEKGFIFFTNKQSRKGLELKKNPFAAMCFYWSEIGKQIRIEGTINEISEEESDEYFYSRSKISQIGAIVSEQSQKLTDYESFIKEVANFAKPIKRPTNWGGIILNPYRIEFWQDMPDRLHKRTIYSQDQETKTWTHNMVYP